VAVVDTRQTATWQTLAARDHNSIDLETWKVARAVIEPVPVVPHVDPEPDPEPAAPEPVDPLAPESPNVATAITGPYNLETVVPKASTVPNAPSATNVASPAPTDAPSATKAPSPTGAPSPTNVPSATEDPEPTGPTVATDGVPATDVPATTDGPETPDLVCLSNPQRRLARRCAAADEAKDQDSGGDNDEPIGDPSLSSTYSLIGTPDNARNALQDAINNKSPDKVGASFNELYVQDIDVAKTAAVLKEDDGDNSLVSSKLADSFSDPDVNISPTTKFVRTRIRSQNDANPREEWDETVSAGPPPEICDAAFSTDGTVAVAINSQAGNDLALESNALKLRWSELMVQQMQGGPNPLSRLLLVVRNRVSNPGTLQTVQEAYANLDITVDSGQKLVLRDTDTDQALIDAFDAMSSTVNVKGVNWMLDDHHTAFGNKKIKTMVIIPNGDEAASEVGLLPSVDIFLQLG
jgi:hypothetical protein